MTDAKPYTEEEIEDLQASAEAADPPMKLFELRWLATVMEMRKHLDEARSHLGAALMQSIPKDDQIIMGHVRDAFRELGGRT